MFQFAKCFESDGRFASLLVGLLSAGLFLLPTSAAAQCVSWDANGKWSFWQGEPQTAKLHSITTITLQQKGTLITGTASAGATNDDGKFFEKKGIVDGSLESDRFSVQIFWNTSEIGIYTAKVLPSGRLQGEAHEKRSPQVSYPWNSTEVLKCPPLPPAPKPIKSSGKAKPAPETPAPPPPTPPFIIAGQPIIPPYMPYGIVPLSWEGGPDHPNVEVWLSMDNGAEIPAFSMEQGPQSPVWKQPKISIALQLQRYHHYRFVLKDAGKTLSTAAFVVP